MILIADGGSTKVDWVLMTTDGKLLAKTQTKSLNPFFASEETLSSRILQSTELLDVKEKVSQLYFYGADCNESWSTAKIDRVFNSIFPNAITQIQEDTYAAVFAIAKTPSIVCILGTGSNVCYFDGSSLRVEVDSLGYVIMDEASGNFFGKRLIRDYYYRIMPEKERARFESSYESDSKIIKQNIYGNENPNRYLASFAPFVFEQENSEYCQSILYEGIKEFFENRILLFAEAKSVPIHFVGSIAYFASDIIHVVAKEYSLKIGNIARKPIEGLKEYHRNLCKPSCSS